MKYGLILVLVGVLCACGRPVVLETAVDRVARIAVQAGAMGSGDCALRQNTICAFWASDPQTLVAALDASPALEVEFVSWNATFTGARVRDVDTGAKCLVSITFISTDSHLVEIESETNAGIRLL